MSRLDSFIRRMQAQRDCLNWAAEAVRDVPGVVLELGLGNGRTYDHLLSILPDRAIYVFDRRVKAHPASVPPADRLLLGEITETLPAAAARLGRTVALAHADVGTGVEADNAALAVQVGRSLAAMMVPGGIVVSDQAMAVPGWAPLPAPAGVQPGRYHLYRAG